MDGEDRGRRISSFVLGGVLGASAAIAAARRRRPRRRRQRRTPQGLAAFEGAPCYREIVERERTLEDGEVAATADGAASRRPRGSRRS